MKNYKILVGCVVLAVFGLYGLIFGAQAWRGRINGQLRVTLDENHGHKPKEEWAMFSVGNSRIFLYSKRTGTVYKFVESGDEWGFKPGTIR